jgi:hypothetical protein
MIDAGHGERGSSIWFGLQPPPWHQTNVDGIKILFDGEEDFPGDEDNKCS